jgi:hypothetical protein
MDEFRLRQNSEALWFPLPALISFGLVAILTGQLLPGLNPRLGSPAQLLPFQAQAEKDGSIWMSISIDSNRNELVVTTANRKVLRFRSNVTSMEDFAPLINHLKEQVQNRIKTAALSRALTTTEITAVLAVDETVKFALVRPIINAIASAGITDYAFETIVTKEM